MSIFLYEETSCEPTDKQPALKVPWIHGVRPYAGFRNPMTRSAVARRVAATFATPATNWIPEVYLFESMAEWAVTLDALLDPTIHGIEVQLLDQVQTKVTHVHFAGINLPEDFIVIHEIVGSYAMANGLTVDRDLLTEDFYHRLAVAAALRWGTLLKMTIDTIGKARSSGSTTLTREHYVDFWVAKTQMNALSTPFTHPAFQTLFRPDKPFQASFS